MAAPYTEQKDHLDFEKLGDTGQDNIDSIAPITNGEPATQTTFRRPSENLRTRTEDVRQFAEEMLYYRDVQHLAISSTGAITWGGTVADAGDGKITQAATIKIKPFLTPRADTKGTLSVGTAAVNQITYTVATAAWSTERLNQVLIEHRNVASSSLTVTISDGPVKRILVVFDAGNSAHDATSTKSAVDAAVAGDTDLNGKITTTINALPTTAISALTETRIEGTAEAEEHVIASGVLDSLTTSNPLQAGDSIAIWYRYLVDPTPGFDGRRESTSVHGTTNVPVGSLFITSLEPSKIPGAIPLCTVEGNTASPGTRLIFIDGTVFNKGDSFLLGGASSSSVYYNGGPNWADATTNPANTVEGQLDKIITDLGGGTGSAKVGSPALTATAPGNDAIGANSIKNQLQGILDLVNDRADLTDTAAQTFAANIKAQSSTAGVAALEGEALVASTNANGVLGIGYGAAAGVRGQINSLTGVGVMGLNPGGGTGVSGSSTGSNGVGVYAAGLSGAYGVLASSDTNYGIEGSTGDSSKAGVRGIAPTGGTGVLGEISSGTSGTAVVGDASNVTNFGIGLTGFSGSVGGAGVLAISQGTGISVLCTGTGTSPGALITASDEGNGIEVTAGGGTPATGTHGIVATGGTNGGTGVKGYGRAGVILENAGVYGEAEATANPSLYGSGVVGYGGGAENWGVTGIGFGGVDHAGAGVKAFGNLLGGIANGGYGLIVAGSATRAAIHFVSQSIAPTSFQNGDMYFDAVAGKLWIRAGAWREIQYV